MANGSPGKALRTAVENTTIQVPGAPNALIARMIEQSDLYEALYLSGAAFSASAFALPDVGLFTLTELVQQASRITRSVNLPLIVDADTGFGEPVNVERTVAELEMVGVAGIQLEDQQLPKRCGHLSGKTLVETDEMCAKLRAAVNTRDDPDLVIIARTDARGVFGLDDAIERAHRYQEAGADWIFPEALADLEEFNRFASEVSAPLLANMTEFGRGPLLTVSQLAELGYAGVLYPVTLLRVAMKAIEAALGVLWTDGTQTELLDLMQTREELYDLLGYDDFDQRDRQYFGLEEKTKDTEI